MKLCSHCRAFVFQIDVCMCVCFFCMLAMLLFRICAVVRAGCTQAKNSSTCRSDPSENVPKEKVQTQLARIIAGNKSKSEKEKKTGIKAIRYDERLG